jgi:hypothetical protein
MLARWVFFITFKKVIPTCLQLLHKKAPGRAAAG